MRRTLTGLLSLNLLTLLGLLLCSPPGIGSDKSDKTDPTKPKDKKTNRLARETSPYLLQHAHNPVDWFPWGPEAFARAKKEGKLVFLSIGYSSCHWCHVMEKESFSNETVAKILNDNFVCIKVDREERPDIDNIYMTALQALGRRGGWPLSMFLTAEGKPFFGGTYWPPEDKEIDGTKVRGFKSLLNLIVDYHKKNAKDIQEDADRLAKATAQLLEGTRGLALLELNRELVQEAVEELKPQFDKEHGGFGSPARNFRGTKFPIPPRLSFLQEEAERTKSKELANIVETTLDHMARGGIYDQLGGGFHRYSTERTWTVPHFEKMLYDNAQLMEVYAHAYRTTKKPLYERIIRETLTYLAREMTSPEGAFYSALDADSEGEEGRFYVWTSKEIDQALPDKKEAEFLRKVYGAEGEANFEGKYHILVLPRPLAETAKQLKLTEEQLRERLTVLKDKLFQVRAKRERPFLDTKVLTAWNGQMIAGYAEAGQALKEKKYLDTAVRAAEFILAKMRTKEGRLLRTYGAAPGGKPEARLAGYLDDYAFLVHGLLALHEATGDKKWLDESRALTDTMIKFHGDDIGGFFYTASDHEKLFARAKDQYDGAQPSGNSVAIRNLVRLWVKTREEKYRTLAEKGFKALGAAYKTNPSGLTTLASALGLYLDAKK